MDSAPATPLLHVGYHKTATTWLQSGLFREESGCFVSPWRRRQIVDHFIAVNPFSFEGPATTAFFADGIKRALDRGLVPVLSHEQLAGNAHTGGHNSKANADRLAAALPAARVLVVIREQQSMVLSVYKQYVRSCGVASLPRYLHPPRRGDNRGVPLFDAAFLEYHRLIGHYVALFGRENVLVLPFEALLRDSAGFVDSVAEFAGAQAPSPLDMEPSNTTISGFSAGLKRWANLVLVRDALNPLAPVDSARVAEAVKNGFQRADRWVPEGLRQRSDARLRNYVARELGGRYRHSNQETSSLAGIDLAAYGYEI